MLAIFQVPNKFFDQEGRVTDISGTDWDEPVERTFSRTNSPPARTYRTKAYPRRPSTIRQACAYA